MVRFVYNLECLAGLCRASDVNMVQEERSYAMELTVVLDWLVEFLFRVVDFGGGDERLIEYQLLAKLR